MYRQCLHHIKQKHSQGFTLLELVVTLAITAILTMIAAAIISIGVDSYNLFTAHATMAREAQNSIRLMSEKIAMADPSTMNQTQKKQIRFDTTSGQSIRFQYNKGNGFLRYKLNTTSWREILHNITDLEFTYMKYDGSEWKNPDPEEELRMIGVTINLSYLGETEDYTATFTIRN